MSTVEVECPRCGARFSIPSSLARVTCPYCFTAFHPEKRLEAEEAQFYFPLYESLDPFEKLVKFLARQYAASRDLPTEFAVTQRELHWVPVYFFFTDFKATARGFSHVYGETITEVTETRLVSIPASGTWLDRELEAYPLPVRGKLPFNPEIKDKGVFHEPQVSREAAEKIAASIIESKVRLEAMESFSSLNSLTVTQRKVEYRGLIYYPVWVLEYSYRNGKYRALVDGASGIVIEAQYPQTAHGRVSLGAYSLLAILFGVAGGLVYAKFFGGELLAPIGGLLVGVTAAIPAITRSVTRVVAVREYLELE
ncbi:hypothetical protein IG193_02690 [Infirmifilum lucidum]|uniref:Uncharacterized protein n=1 Tax=Infirmifilum lucidum TaxID=2776706 RepID=A0A7L9FI44_9CREN|nr:hypothetical protein [Infirmifilum lucidum]QOJ79387.1 hypothetical protein IG193_02690 [Infirmifilum lucidum]